MAQSLLAGSPDRELGAMALDMGGWTDEAARALAVSPDAAIDGIQRSLRPLREVEPGAVVADDAQACGFRFDGKATPRLADALRPLGVKINPTIGDRAAGAWLAAMIASLGDLPPRIAIRATEDALHVSIRFFPEVESVIREKAKAHQLRYEVALSRLDRLKRDLERPAAPALTPREDAKPLSYAALARRGMGPELLALGLRNGFLTQEEYDAAISPVEMESENG